MRYMPEPMPGQLWVRTYSNGNRWARLVEEVTANKVVYAMRGGRGMHCTVNRAEWDDWASLANLEIKMHEKYALSRYGWYGDVVRV